MTPSATTQNIFDIFYLEYSINYENYMDFYTHYRNTVCNSLKKKGCYLNGHQLLADEILSPTFEDVVILLCLEKIDTRLPKAADEKFRERLIGNISLKDLQDEIFTSIPELLAKHPQPDVFTVVVNTDEFIVQHDDDNVRPDENDDFKEEIVMSYEDMLHEDEPVKPVGCDVSNTLRREGGDNSIVHREADEIRVQNNGIAHKPLIECPICSKQFSTKKKLLNHARNHEMKNQDIKEEASLGFPDENESVRGQNGDLVGRIISESKLECSTCLKVFSTKKKLWDHSRVHKKEKSFCNICRKEFKSRKALVDHNGQFHRVTHHCSKCDEVLVGNFKYMKHVKIKHPEHFDDDQIVKDYLAQTEKQEKLSSEENITNDTSIKLHLNTEDDLNKPKKTSKNLKSNSECDKIVCDICAKVIKIKNIGQHNKTHCTAGMTCTKCDISFQERKNYLRHMRTHKDKVKKASCEHCGQLFTEKSHLKKHMKIHQIGDVKLKCETCGRSFFDVEDMRSHVCKHHACQECGIKFMRVRNLEKHKRIHLGETVFGCDLCESMFLTRKRLSNHISYQHKKEKKNKCPVLECGKTFLMKSGLAAHLLTHTGEKPFKCKHCNLSFSQKGNFEVHQRLHTNQFQYSCNVCDAKFMQSGELKRHRETKKCGFTEEDFCKSEQSFIV